MEADQNDQLELLPTLKERIDEEVDAVFVRHGYQIDGEPHRRAAEDKLYDLVSTAVVEKRADRGQVAITRRAMMAAVFPHVPGPEAWAEQDDEELAEGVYQRLDGFLWRKVQVDQGGAVQDRLNSDTGLILCRTRATPNSVEAVYVTRDLACLLADFTSPQKDRIKKEADRFAKNLGMAGERLPEFAGRFRRELTSGMKAALGSGTAILDPILEAATADDEDDDIDDQGDDE